MNGKLLTIKNLSAWYRREHTVLEDFSIELQEHEVVGLIGLNGAGKTTFIKTLSGLHETFSAEEIRLYDRPVQFRDQAFKTCRYTVFAEDHSFSILLSGNTWPMCLPLTGGNSGTRKR